MSAGAVGQVDMFEQNVSRGDPVDGKPQDP